MRYEPARRTWSRLFRFAHERSLGCSGHSLDVANQRIGAKSGQRFARQRDVELILLPEVDRAAEADHVRRRAGGRLENHDVTFSCRPSAACRNGNERENCEDHDLTNPFQPVHHFSSASHRMRACRSVK
jgi:hypothetical protein